MSEIPVDIRLYWAGKEYASRQWTHVPRVGDEIMLHPDHAAVVAGALPDKTGKVPFRVKRVVWGVESVVFSQRQSVNMEIVLCRT